VQSFGIAGIVAPPRPRHAPQRRRSQCARPATTRPSDVPQRPNDPLDGLTVLERGWLSSNNVLVHAAPGEAGALLVDTSHVNHREQTVALVRHALAGRPLALVANTHLHSDHCGGNAAVQAAFGAPLALPPGQAEAVARWDEEALSYRRTGQRIEPFRHQAVLQPGQALRAGGREWEVIAAPGHDPHAVMLFDRAHGVLISADALWQNGFGLVFPELDGEPGFDDVARVLDRIATLPVKVVVPGHGAPFTDVDAALQRAASRLRSWQTDPVRHRRHGAKVLLKYHVMEEGVQALPELLAWAQQMPHFVRAWQHLGDGLDAAAWCRSLIEELAGAGALRLEGGRVHDA
jgi:glyoxylase-like metal-dependent hydrolase (beta-lactamase superfamily II)